MNSLQERSPLERAVWWVGRLALLLSVGVLGAWLADAAATGLAPAASRALVLAALAIGLVYLLLVSAAAWKRHPGEPRWGAGRALLVLVLLAFVVRWAGVQFELLDHYHNDEGVFFAEGERINEGQLLPETFNYGHFLYYTSAVILWIERLFRQASLAAGQSIFGFEEGFAMQLLLLRAFTAALGALTVVPVFVVGRRVGGLLAGILGGALIVFSPLYNEVAQLTISDVPAGFFAAVTMMYVARLLDGENVRDYLLAGVAAGLAAASKYPGGVAAVGIIGIWVYWRIRTRRLSWHLVGSGLISLLTFLALMPAIWMMPDQAFSGQGMDITFGWRQYARSGWIGTLPQSNLVWYGGKLAQNFGIPALLLGLVGLGRLEARDKWRVAALLPFPLFYLFLICSMNMVVMRNLQPVLPMVAALLGVGVAAWKPEVESVSPGARRHAAAILCLVALTIPAVRTALWDISRVRPGTRQLARTFVEENYPWGTGVIAEAYTARLNASRNLFRGPRYAARLSMEEIRDPAWDLLMLTPNAYLRFFKEQRGDWPWLELRRDRYRKMFELPLVKEFRPGPLRAGSQIYLYRLEPEEIVYRRQRTFLPEDVAFASDAHLMPREPREVLRFTRPRQKVLFKEFFEPGEYRVRLLGGVRPPRGGLVVHSRDNELIAQRALKPELRLSLPRRDKYFFRVHLQAKRQLGALEITPVE